MKDSAKCVEEKRKEIQINKTLTLISKIDCERFKKCCSKRTLEYFQNKEGVLKVSTNLRFRLQRIYIPLLSFCF